MSDVLPQARTRAGRSERPARVKVWDPLVRAFHWSLVVAFAFAYLSGDEWDKAHEAAGYVVAGLIAFRLVWGLIGPRHARFTDFVRPPGTVLGYVKDTIFLRARRYIGHNPAGGAMIVALLLALAAVSATGIAMTTDTFWGVGWVEETHEVAANLTLALVFAHIAGVAIASFEHRENLVKAMVTGWKRAPAPDEQGAG